MAKLYFHPDSGAIVVRRDDDDHDVSEMIEVSAEQASALSLSYVGQAISALHDVLDDKLGK